MNEVEWIREIDGGSTFLPDVDVARRVRQTIASRNKVDQTVFPIAAGASMFVGIISIMLTMQTWVGADDPLTRLTDMFQLVLQ